MSLKSFGRICAFKNKCKSFDIKSFINGAVWCGVIFYLSVRYLPVHSLKSYLHSHRETVFQNFVLEFKLSFHKNQSLEGSLGRRCCYGQLISPGRNKLVQCTCSVGICPCLCKKSKTSRFTSLCN